MILSYGRSEEKTESRIKQHHLFLHRFTTETESRLTNLDAY